ncbi:MAG: ISAs1 family transposase, partial [Chlamydiia bacterium]|nr:ISAs1 family transposase [Chlamydiia bacterium]
HGRSEEQKIWVTQDLNWLETKKDWKVLCSLICIERNREAKGERKSEIRYYISSAERTPQEFGELVRRHWAIENEYHWHLDVTFSEDDSEISARSNKVLRVARTIALQLLKTEPTKGMSIRRKKRKCGRSTDYLKEVLLVGKF